MTRSRRLTLGITGAGTGRVPSPNAESCSGYWLSPPRGRKPRVWSRSVPLLGGLVLFHPSIHLAEGTRLFVLSLFPTRPPKAPRDPARNGQSAAGSGDKQAKTQLRHLEIDEVTVTFGPPTGCEIIT